MVVLLVLMIMHRRKEKAKRNKIHTHKKDTRFS